MIELVNLTKTYSSSAGCVEAVHDVSLSIKEGEIFGIIGLSGAGKSTLIRCINFLEVPTSGSVVFDGLDLGSLSKKELLMARRSMGMIFQGFNLLSQRTVLKNVTFPLEIAGVNRADAASRARELLEMVGLSEKASAYPSQLSGGQQQRVAIARALATKPKVLLCDEATSALDPTTTQSILSLLKKINEEMGVTVVVITHEMKVIEQICSRVAVLDGGRIAEQGDVSEVFIHPKSDIARSLVLPKNENPEMPGGKRCLRLVFDGDKSLEPIISQMSLECRAAVNIVFANMKTIEKKAYGQMIIQLPEDNASQERMLSYLERKGIIYKEEILDDIK